MRIYNYFGRLISSGAMSEFQTFASVDLYLNNYKFKRLNIV